MQRLLTEVEKAEIIEREWAKARATATTTGIAVCIRYRSRNASNASVVSANDPTYRRSC